MNDSKGYWTGEQVKGYNRKQQLLVPKKTEMLETMVQVLPFPQDMAIDVLEFGSGLGALTEQILQRYSRARITCVDSSSEMLQTAKNQLAKYVNQISFVQGDFNDEKWMNSIDKQYDLIASSIALHYLRPENRDRFYRQCYELLNSSGCFVNGTGFKAKDPMIQQMLDSFQAQYIQQQLKRLHERDLSIEEIERKRKVNRKQAGVQFYTVDEQVTSLRYAGFSQVGCVWRYFQMAIVLAIKE